MSSVSDVNISLEQRLIETLDALVPILPGDLSAELSAVLGAASKRSPTPFVTPPPPSPNSTAYSKPLIRYSLLSAISTWTRSAEGRKALTEHDPPLDPNTFAMVALLAGTRTSPEKKFPDVSIVVDGTDSRKELDDRRAVTAVINALLSIFGAGAATWWATGRLGWRDEWKVLLALAAAIVVASSEAILYLIWASRRSTSRVQLARGRRIEGPPAAVSGRTDPSQELSEQSEKDTRVAGPPQLNAGVLPPASPAVQEHRTAGGLRERKQGFATTGRT